MAKLTHGFRKFVRRGAVLVVATVVASAGVVIAPANAVPPIVEPAPPADSFYDAPADLADMKPGEIVRSRPTSVRSLQVMPVNVDAWQLAYRTTGMDGVPDMTVTTVMVPRGKKPTKLLSYQAASDSTLRVCQASYSLTKGGPVELGNPSGPLTFGMPAAEMLFASAGLNEGWAVAMPDHGGGDDRFLTPRQPGWAVLDGIRAVENFSRLGLNEKTPVGLMGYSGGAIASSWTIEEQPEYAPELNIRGAAFGAPERDLEASLRSVNTSLLAGLIPLALSAIGKDSEPFRKALDGALTRGGRDRVNETRRHCMPQNVVSNLWFDYRVNLSKPIDDVLKIPAIRKAIDERGVSGRIPKVPAYVYNGITEEVAPITGTDKLVNSYCRGGASVTYRREELPPNPVPQLMTTHGTVVITGAGGAIDWIKQRMNSTGPAPKGCDIRDVLSSGLEPAALQTFGQSIGAIIATLVNAPIGAGPRP
ncbi:lipase family protein [Tsukamurella sp. 1534]|uniref:lipase family protein n=1 Tax=Tsukamurella sp. 1534 TaxID=1151061 RepID=UPI0002F16799|nr:lipase family protein [Tsukamurella sp. 1534]